MIDADRGAADEFNPVEERGAPVTSNNGRSVQARSSAPQVRPQRRVRRAAPGTAAAA